MNIKKVSAVSDNCVLKSNARKQPENVYVQIPNDLRIQKSMDMLAVYNMAKISFGRKDSQDEYKLNYSSDELKNRLSPEAFTEFRMLDKNAIQYKNLKTGDKEALKHLVRAAQILDDVYLRQDNIHNLPFRNYLENEIEKGSNDAANTAKLFYAQKGIIGKTVDGKEVYLAKGIDLKPGKGFYPEDLSEKEFHKIIKDMLKDGEIEEVQKILNQRTIVERDGKKLKATDYTDYFKDEFSEAANELELAAMTSTNDDFNRYLILQANALMMNNPYMDALADKKWAKLQNTPLEFTIGRESYDDRLTPTISKDKELCKLLEKFEITPYAKDNIGVRVGIVNKEGTDYILKIKQFMPYLAAKMPYNNEYEQTISKITDNKQTMVDADIVAMTGQFGAYRGAISIASNLPNNDKLSVQTGGGKRNVYHIQMRNSKYADNKDNMLNALLNKTQHKYFDTKALHDFTILHENVHSLGPKDGLEALGVYKNTIEEHKADMGAIVMLDELTKKGFYSPLKEKQVITSYLTAYVLKGPDFENAHRARNILQHNYFIKNGAVDVSKDGKMTINFDKVVDCAHEMLEKAVKIQLDKDAKKAEQYIKENAVWSKELDKMAENLRSVDKKLNSYVTMPLAEELLSE